LYVYLNSRLLAAAAAMVPVFDRGFAYGDSLIETLKIRRGFPVFFEEHLARLREAMDLTGFENRLDGDGLFNQAVSLAEANAVTEGRLRIQLSRGTPRAPAGLDPAAGLAPTLLLTAEAFAGYPPEIYEQGVVCASVAANRGSLAAIKSGSLLATVLARRQAAASGAWEAVFTSGHGRLLEGSFTNLFFLTGGKLVTAGGEQPVLQGIAREKVIGLAAQIGLEVAYEAPLPGELHADEDSAFLTSSLLGICPVRRIDALGLKLERELTDQLAARLDQLELDDIEQAAAGRGQTPGF